MMENILKIGIVSTILILFVSCRPIHQPTNSCVSSHNVGIQDENGTITCLTPTSCPLGFGFTVQLGKVYSKGTIISCYRCKVGVTFSDKHDLSQCKSCKICGKDELAFGQCTTQKDSTTCECKSLYFKSKQDTKCYPCSSCCGEATEMHCISPEARRCSLETRCSHTQSYNITNNKSQEINNTEVLGYKHPDPPDPSHNGQSLNLLWIYISVIIFMVPGMAVGFVYFYKRRPQPITNNNWNVSRDHVNMENIYLQTFISQNSPTVPLLDKECQQFTSNTQQESERSQNRESVTQALMNADREIPRSLDSNREECVTPKSSTSVESGLSDGNIIPENENSPLVTQLPEELLQNICNVLDKSDDFFRDYRMLTDELIDREQFEISSLENTDSPTRKILEITQLTIKRFLEIIENYFISPISDRENKTQKESERIDVLVDILEKVKAYT